MRTAGGRRPPAGPGRAGRGSRRGPAAPGRRRHRVPRQPFVSEAWSVIDRRVGEHDVEGEVGGVPGEHLEVVRRREAVGLPGLRGEVERPAAGGPRSSGSAAASSGTSRCGITLVNHEPGPSTTQSASSTACTACGQAGGASGSSETLRTRPGVVATATWPRTRSQARRRASPRRPRCPAVRRTSAAPGRGRRAAGRPSRARTPSRRAAPTARRSAGCRRRARAARPRCGSGAARPRLQVWPHSSSPHSAASAIRRSPGGSTPSSRRSRPLEPPSSATVTTAVSRSVTRRSADSDAASPCPPPSATTRGRVRERVRDGHAHSRPRSRWTTAVSTPWVVSRRGELLGHRDDAVLAAGAADRDRDVPLALALVARRR